MVRTYIPKRQKQYTDDAIQRGLQLMNDGGHLRKLCIKLVYPLKLSGDGLWKNPAGQVVVDSKQS